MLPGETGTLADRKFPALQMTVLVGRKPHFYIWNILLPCTLFVPMAALQFMVQRDQVPDRLGVSLAIVLTAIAHKYSMTTLVPSVSYLTFLDKYVLISLLLIFIITGQGAVVGWFERYYCRTQAIYPTDLLASAPLANLTSSVSGTIRRRLVTASTAASATAAASSSSQLDHAVPIGYEDQDCPYSAMGPLTRFDWYDRQCAIVDMVLWLLLQLWALVLWVRGKNRLERRIEVIDRLHDGFISRDEANLYSQTDASDPEQGKPAAPSSTRADNDAEGEADASRPVERSPSDRKLCAVLKTAHLSAKRVVPLNGPAAAPLKNFAHLSDAHHRDAADELAPRDQKVAASPSAASKSPAVGAPVRMEP